MAAIRWTVTASDDLRAIEEFVARDSPLYAVRLVDGLIGAVDRLEQFPLSGRLVPELGRNDLREIIHGSYRVVYRESRDTVTILRIVHSARDMWRLPEPWPTNE
jgi:toxin ParE1/3/4